ncbi:MAG: histidine phosphatase family protein [Acidobacteria bacterium]|nr:histidine phosphatase family protein [Acidobacteriota bacterium]
MSTTLPTIYLARHGETAWSRSGQHTGLTDLPLLPEGEAAAVKLGERLAGLAFARVWTSPLQRASRTCDIAGFGAVAETDPDLVEWDYGDYEGLRSAEIRAKTPNWKLFRDGAPNGESVDQISARADRVVARLRSLNAGALVFSSGHFLRVLATRWIGLELHPSCLSFQLSTASLSALGYEHDLTRPVVQLWNETYFHRST